MFTLSILTSNALALTLGAGPSLIGPLPFGPLLAEGGAAAANPYISFAPIALILVLAYFLFVVPQRNKERRYQQMIDALKQHDRVVTTGGLHGVVTAVQRDAGEATLRVDESTGAKIQVSLWAIDSVPSQGASNKEASNKGAPSKETKKKR